MEKRSFSFTLILALLPTGLLGMDRFYLGKIGTGILKFITLGGCGIWYIVDIIRYLTKDDITDYNGNELTGREVVDPTLLAIISMTPFNWFYLKKNNLSVIKLILLLTSFLVVTGIAYLIWCLVDLYKALKGQRVPSDGREVKRPQTCDQGVALLYALFLGTLGIDRFYLGHRAMGLIKLCTCGGFGIITIIDVILIITGGMKDASGKDLNIL